MELFSHITIGVNDLDRSKIFYDAVLSKLDVNRHSDGETFAGYGEAGITGKNSLWILKPNDGNEAKGGNGANIAFLARSRQMVDAFYSTAIDLGAKSDGAPGIRKEAHENFYACYVIDFDGNKLVAVCHDPE